MKIIKPKIEEIKDFEGVDNFYKTTARAARICYASDKITEDKKLCERLIKLGHLSPFEHSILYIPIYGEFRKWAIEHRESKEWKIIDTAKTSRYTVVNCNKDDNFEIAINGRTLVESIREHSDNVIQTLDSILEIVKMFELNNHWFKSFIVDTSIGCTREMNRHHDNFYICEQSTRFCNFSKDKFGNEVAFNKPYWYDEASIKKQNAWEFAMRQAEFNYLDNQKDFTIDEIRGVLPLDTHTKVIYTSTIEEWQHIVDMRLKGSTGKPHGDIMIVADKINKFINDEKKV